jgi:integrase
VVKIGGVDCLHIEEKTDAGIRDVPIHPEIADLVRDLANASTDGFLIPSETDKYGRRGDALGKRFTRLKTDLKFDKLHTFHSLRHTVVHLFREAECPVEIRNQILGHEDGDTGAGSGYGGHVGEKLKLEWLTKAIRYEKLKRQAV